MRYFGIIVSCLIAVVAAAILARPFLAGGAALKMHILPAEQKAFVDAMLDGRRDYNAAVNDLARRPIEKKMEDGLCTVVMPSRAVANWYGFVEGIEPASGGGATLALKVADDVTLRTRGGDMLGALQDHESGEKTLVEKDSPLFKTLLGLRVGQQIQFSGNFLPDDKGNFCVKALTMTANRADFLFRFTAANPVD